MNAKKGAAAALLAAAAIVALLLAAPAEAADGAAPPLSVSYRNLTLVPLPEAPPPVHGTFQVQVFRDGAWRDAGGLDASHRYADHALTLAGLPTGAPVRIAIRAQGGHKAHLDNVTLDGKPPLTVRGAAPAKLAGREYDVADITGQRVELTFAPPGRRTARLALRGRIEGPVNVGGPLRFPAGNTGRRNNRAWRFYAYRLGDQPGQLQIDGELRGEGLGPPFFANQQRIVSGHPQAPTYGWVRNDDRNLYVAIDFVPDNTLDGHEDYALVYVRQPDGVRAFRVSVPETRWGRAGFTYTQRATWQHKVYEFAIPLAELGVNAAERPTLRLAFEAYGTAGAEGDYRPGVARDPVNDRFLVAWQNSSDSSFYAQVYNQHLQPVGSRLTLESSLAFADLGPPDIAFDTVNTRYLVVWDNGNSGIHAQLVNPNGTKQGTLITIVDGDGDEHPAVAYNPDDGEFLVVWAVSNDIVGQRLTAATGALVGTPGFAIKTGGTSLRDNPDVAYNPEVLAGAGGYLVVYEDDDLGTSGTGVYGWLLNATGVAQGSQQNPGPLPGSGDALRNPRLTVESINGYFFIAFSRESDGQVLGGPLNFDGSPRTPPYDKFGTAEPYELATAADFNEGPDVGFDPVHQRHIVAWQHGTDHAGGYTSTTAVHARWLGIRGDYLDLDPDDGVDLADPANGLTLNPTGFAVSTPRLAFDEACGNFLAVYQATLFDASATETGALAFSTIGRCSKVLVSSLSGYTTEQGTIGRFTVALNAEPSANVTIPLSSSDATEGKVSPASLTFTPDNWATPQVVTVTGVDDATADGDVAYSVQFGAITSSDPTYAAIAPAALSVTNLDDETAGFLLGAVNRPTDEGGTTATFTVKLATKPSANVTIALSSSDTGEATVSPASLTFTAANWSTGQTVTATGVDDTAADGPQPYYVVTGAATSSDPTYSGRNPPDVLLFNLDDETTLLTFTSGSTSIVTPGSGPAGTEFTFMVVYRSVTNTAPLVHDLKIDLDGDGAYTAAAATAQRRTLPPAGTMAAALALLLALGTVGVTQPALRRAGVVLSVLAVVGLGALAGLSGCGGGGGGGGGDETPPPAPGADSEVITMEPVDAADANYLDGRSYTATKVISGAARDVTFELSFSADGVTPVAGDAAGPHTVTVTAQ